MTETLSPADRDDVVWLAGLLEGEGSFDLHRGKYPRIRVGMTDRDVVGRAATLMGSRIRLSLRPSPYKATWHAEVSGPKAEAVMVAILPFMGSRRSGKIAGILGARAMPPAAFGRSAATPGPALTRPPGLRPHAPIPLGIAS